MQLLKIFKKEHHRMAVFKTSVSLLVGAFILYFVSESIGLIDGLWWIDDARDIFIRINQYMVIPGVYITYRMLDAEREIRKPKEIVLFLMALMAPWWIGWNDHFVLNGDSRYIVLLFTLTIFIHFGIVSYLQYLYRKGKISL